MSDFYFMGGKRQSENQAYDNTSNYTYMQHIATHYVSTTEHPDIGSVPALLLRVEPRRRRGRRHAWGKLHNPRPLAAKVEVFLSVHVHRAIGREIPWW